MHPPIENIVNIVNNDPTVYFYMLDFFLIEGNFIKTARLKIKALKIVN